MITAEGMAAVDENMAGATLTSVMTENATSVTVDDDRFEIAGGNLKLKDGMSLDFEGDDGGSIDVTITATGDGESATHTVTVTINDVQEAPTIDVRDGEEVPQKGVTSSLTIDENATGADIPPLALIHVTDPDAADATTGQAGADLVTLSGGMEDYFEVVLDPENGLWLALKDGASFNYEEHGDSVMVTVTYTDTAGHAASTDVTVMVNDVNEAPVVDADMEVDDAVFVGGQENSIEIDLKALFTDPDGDGLNYRLSDNAPDWLEFSVTIKGTGEDQTITGKLYGTPPESDITADGVSIIATDGGGLEAHAMFDVVVDEENDAPTRLELRVTDDEGVTERVTEVSVEENDAGAMLGNLVLDDPDDARHPHGMHTYTFMVDGEADDRFEVVDGMLKLKDDAALDIEEDGGTIKLTVTATDMHVHEPDEGEDATTESISREITITVGDVDVGETEGPRLTRDEDGNPTKVGPVTITVDEDLEEDDVDAGDWLKKIPANLSRAFEDPDGDDLTYSLGSGAPRWLEIDEETGRLTNKEFMLPNRGVYDVTIVASDDDGNSAEITIQLAVAISDDGDEDNDEPDIRNIDEIGYEEGDESGPVVATFEVDDDDIEIAPHPYGVHKIEFTAEQDPGDGSDPVDVTNAFKIVWVRDDGNDTAYYEIRAKTPAELAMGADGDDKGDEPDVYPANHPTKAGEVIPVPEIDYEEGDEIDFEITVTDMDGKGETDDRSLSIDVEDAPDESPVFQRSVTGGAKGEDDTTTIIKVNQETEARTILVMRLDELWEDADTDDDDLTFDVDGTSDLPDWIKVYGPDRWEDIYENRRNDFTDDEVDAVEDVRDRDDVVVIVMDRTATDGENVSLGGGSFTITADDGDNDPVTETIMLSVTNTNVDPADDTKVVSISGGDPNEDKEVTGTGNLTMAVDFSQDPDLKGGEHPYLVLYTWMVSTDEEDDTATTDVDESMTTISVSATNEPLKLGVGMPGMMTRIAAYVDQTITAKVEIFEWDPQTGKVTMAQEYTATVDTASDADAPVTPPQPTSVTFGELLTDTSGLSVTITATGEAAEAGTARLEVSNDGSSGWITVDSTAADTSTGVTTSPVTLDVDADGDDSDGDGGGLYYRVVYVYEDEDENDVEVASDVIQLGSVETDPTTGATPMVGATTTAVSGETIRVDTGTNDVEVQWQMGSDVDTSGTIEEDEWNDIDGETGLSLSLGDAQAGMSVRALVTYMGDEDNPDHVTWVEYSSVVTVAALPTAENNTPDRTQATTEIRVNPDTDDDGVAGTGAGNVSGFFFDADGDDLTYTLVGAAVDDGAEGIQPGNTVYRSEDDEQIFTLNKETGAITYYTNNGTSHGFVEGGTAQADPPADGAGNLFRVSVESSDGKPDATDDTTDDVTIDVRVNVAPTDIFINSAATGADKASATDSTLTFAETAEFDATDGGTTSVELDVQDLNLNTDDFGSHTVTVDDNRFTLERTAGTDMSQWTLGVKEDAEFDYEHEDNPMGVITLKLTATDKGGKSVERYVTVTLTDVDTGTGEGNENTEDPQYEEPDTSGAGSGGIMTTGAGAGDDDDGAGDPPGDGGLWVDEDLLNDFVISIEDFDIA